MGSIRQHTAQPRKEHSSQQTAVFSCIVQETAAEGKKSCPAKKRVCSVF